MKFGSLLKELSADEAGEIYAKYKHLKKVLKDLASEEGGAHAFCT